MIYEWLSGYNFVLHCDGWSLIPGLAIINTGQESLINCKQVLEKLPPVSLLGYITKLKHTGLSLCILTYQSAVYQTTLRGTNFRQVATVRRPLVHREYTINELCLLSCPKTSGKKNFKFCI